MADKKIPQRQEPIDQRQVQRPRPDTPPAPAAPGRLPQRQELIDERPARGRR